MYANLKHFNSETISAEIKVSVYAYVEYIENIRNAFKLN